MTTDAQRKAVKAYAQKRAAEGHHRAAFWFSPAHLAILDRAAATFGSRQLALEEAIKRLKG